MIEIQKRNLTYWQPAFAGCFFVALGSPLGSQPGQNPRQFLNGFQNAYILGTQGNQAALEKSKAAAYLADEQRQTAFLLGEKEARNTILGNGKKPAELINRRQGSLENSGDNDIIKKSQRGAYNDKNDPFESKREHHANRYYESVRNGKKDYVVRTISRNTGIDAEMISKMVDHVFINEYDLDKGYVRFDADYDIAESVRRLREGKYIQEHDLILIYHESLEYDLMNKDGLKYEDAHEKANEQYNYLEALKKWKEKMQRR